MSNKVCLILVNSQVVIDPKKIVSYRTVFQKDLLSEIENMSDLVHLTVVMREWNVSPVMSQNAAEFELLKNITIATEGPITHETFDKFFILLRTGSMIAPNLEFIRLPKQGFVDENDLNESRINIRKHNMHGILAEVY